MKKALAIICAVAVVLSLSVTAFADGPSQNQSSGFSQHMPGNFQQGQGPNMGGQPPMMGGQPPMMNGQAPSGEAPSDLPERPEFDGEAPDFSGEAPEFDGQAPDMNGRPPMMGGQGQFGAPAFVDFDTMVEDGVISQDTYDKIKAYMEENKPDDLPEMNGEAPKMGSQPPMMNGQAPDGEAPTDLPERPEMNGEAPADLPEPPEMNGEAPEFDGKAPEFDAENSFVNGLLNDLLEAEVITQAEYDALVAALSK